MKSRGKKSLAELADERARKRQSEEAARRGVERSSHKAEVRAEKADRLERLHTAFVPGWFTTSAWCWRSG